MTLQSTEALLPPIEAAPANGCTAPFNNHAVPLVPVGVAIGNNAGKISVDGADYVIRTQSIEDHPNMLKGSDRLLLGDFLESSIYAGKVAIGEGLDTCNGVQTLAHGLKGELYARHALLGIAHVVPNGAAVAVAVSLPASSMKPLVEPLKGTHTLIINGVHKTISIQRLSFHPEGLGAAKKLRELRLSRNTQPVPSFAALDLGGGNCSIVGLDDEGSLSGFAQTTPGVFALYSDIAAAVAGDQGGIAPTLEAVRLGVELKTFNLGGYGETNFKAVYDAAFPKWLASRLREIRAEAGNILDRSAVKVLCGGGANLPGLVEQLPDGYVKASNPQQIESQGLLEFARGLVSNG